VIVPIIFMAEKIREIQKIPWEKRSLEIVPIKVETKDAIKEIFFRDPIPKLPSIVMLDGKKGTGKTQILMNLMLFHWRKKKGNKDVTVFDEICIMSPTLGADDTFNDVFVDPSFTENNTYMTGEFDEKLLQEIVDSKKRCYRLVVIEDCADRGKTLLDVPAVRALFMRGRHRGITVVFTTQYLNCFPPDLRAQIDYAAVFPLSQPNDLQYVRKAFSTAQVDGDAFDDMFHNATNDQHDFLWCDRVKWKFWYKWDEPYEMAKVPVEKKEEKEIEKKVDLADPEPAFKEKKVDEEVKQ
jgi:hypothetical protein